MKKHWKEMKKGDHIWVIDTGTVLPDGCEIIRGTLLSDYAEHNELVKMLTPKLKIYLNGIRENISNYNRLMNRIKSIVEDND